MTVPGKRLTYIMLLCSLTGIASGLLLLFSPASHLILLAILNIICGESAFLIWGLLRVRNSTKKNQKLLCCLFAAGLLSFLLALSILLFRPYLQMYIIQITALGLLLASCIQRVNVAFVQPILKPGMTMFLAISVIAILVLFVPFIIFPPFTPELRSPVLAILSFIYAAHVVFTFFVVKASFRTSSPPD